MTHTTRCMLHALGGAALFVLGTPCLALAEAEEQNTGMMLLMPNLAEFIPACIAFLIIWFLFAKFVWPKVLGMMDNREAKLQADYDAADQAKAKALADQQAAAKLLADAQRDASDIVAQARRDAEEERTRLITKAQKDAYNIITKAHDALALERQKAMVELSSSVVDLSVEIAGKIVGNDLSDDEHRALAEKYLAEVGKSNDA